jgi:hypothetical protein
MSFLLAFGGGALLAALTIDLIAPGVDRGHFGGLALGAVAGSILFKLLDWAVNRKGGYLRKPSTAMTHWRSHARKRFQEVVSGLRRTHPLRDHRAGPDSPGVDVKQVPFVNSISHFLHVFGICEVVFNTV